MERRATRPKRGGIRPPGPPYEVRAKRRRVDRARAGAGRRRPDAGWRLPALLAHHGEHRLRVSLRIGAGWLDRGE